MYNIVIVLISYPLLVSIYLVSILMSSSFVMSEFLSDSYKIGLFLIPYNVNGKYVNFGERGMQRALDIHVAAVVVVVLFTIKGLYWT